MCDVFDVRETVVGDVEFLQCRERLEVLEGGDSIGLNAEDAEGGEGREVLRVRMCV